MIGKRFGNLTVVSEVAERSKNNHILYRCLCTCGSSVVVLGASLRYGGTKSCGCFHKTAVTKHNMEGTPTYKTWADMKVRCDPMSKQKYPNYAGRGIGVCDRWQTFENFYDDMGERAQGKSLDRIDNNKGYCPENCRWATPKQQCNNRRNTVYVKHNGKILNVWQFAKEIKLSESGALKRVHREYRKDRNGIFVKEAT